MTKFAKLNFYQRLHVRPSASCREIRAVYREIATIYHASTNTAKARLTRSTITKNSEVFKLITEAHQTLSNPERRARYDRMLVRQHLRDGTDMPRSRSMSIERRRRSSARRGYDTAIASTRRKRSRSAFTVLALTLLGQRTKRRSRTATGSSAAES